MEIRAELCPTPQSQNAGAPDLDDANFEKSIHKLFSQKFAKKRNRKPTRKERNQMRQIFNAIEAAERENS